MIDKTSLDNARSIDLIAFLERYKGFHFRHLGGEYRCAEHTSLAVKSDRLSWYWHSKGIGGYGAIDFLMKIEGCDFKGALQLLPMSRPMHHFHHQQQTFKKLLFFPREPTATAEYLPTYAKQEDLTAKS